jgi:2-polyprenyl-6-methoxyphenol hydroxylase-like FAD-dependent oxidoreductase
MAITLTNNKIAYIISEQLDDNASKDLPALRKKLLSPEAKEAFIKKVSGFSVKTYSDDNDRPEKLHTLGDLIEATDSETSGMVLLEEKMFKTWHHGRTVLLGDAVHKMHLASGMGCVNAMQDAVILTNCLYEIADGKEEVTSERISEAFKDYREQRFFHANYQIQDANRRAQLAGGHVRDQFAKKDCVSLRRLSRLLNNSIVFPHILETDRENHSLDHSPSPQVDLCQAGYDRGRI